MIMSIGLVGNSAKDGYEMKSEYVMIPLKNLDAQKFHNCQFLAPSFLILAKTLDYGILKIDNSYN